MSQHAAAPREDRAALGLAMMCVAVCCFTGIDTSAKWLILSGLPALQVVFARYAGHFILTCAVVLPREGLGAFHSNRPKLQFLRAVFLLGSTFLNFLALGYLPITVTTTIMFAGPILVTLLSIPVLGEKVGIRRIAAVCTGFAGVLITMQPWGAAFHPAMFLTLAAITSGACYFVLTRYLAGIETNATAQLWTSGVATLALAPLALPVLVWPDTGLQWLILVTIGCWGGTGHALATAAHRYADASLLAPVAYFQLLSATFAGVVVFGDLPTFWTLVGASIIIASGIYIWLRERKQKQATPPQEFRR